MNKYWISFGQTHTHSVNGKTLDKDCLLEIEAENEEAARNQVIALIGLKWANIYEELEGNLEYFPRGVIKLTNE
jgi:hypothetical protein